jgi:hypothetical protein
MSIINILPWLLADFYSKNSHLSRELARRAGCHGQFYELHRIARVQADGWRSARNL